MPDPMISRRGALGAVGIALVTVSLGRPACASRPSGRFAVEKSAAEWRRLLGPERFAVLRQGATERPGTSPLDKEKRRGTFTCAGCAPAAVPLRIQI